MIREANVIAEELGLCYSLQPKLLLECKERQNRKRTTLGVSVCFKQVEVYVWQAATLQDRIFIMRDLFNNWVDAEDKHAFVQSKKN